MKTSIALLAASFASLWSATSHAGACPACSNPNLPGAGPSDRRNLAEGQLVLGARVVGTHIDASHTVDPDDYEPARTTPVQPYEHVVSTWFADLELSAALGLSDRVGLDVRLPLRLAVVDAEFRDDQGRAMAGFESIHHRDETIFAPADLELWSRLRLVASTDAHLDLRLGTTFPTGPIEPDPYALAHEGKAHEHMFFGSGTADPLVGTDASYAIGDGGIVGWATARLSYAENRLGYRPGKKIAAGVAYATGFGLPRWTFLAGPELYHEGISEWDGVPAENTGRTDIVASVGAVFRPASEWTVSAFLRKPFTVAEQGGQVSIPLVVGLGASISLGVFGSREEPRWEPKPASAGDVADVSRNGDSFEIDRALVRGKVTVVDFWASWCKPCAGVDRVLREIAAKNPHLAVRRAEVVDFDSPVARQHLSKAVALPTVWIFDPAGRRVVELAGTSSEDVRARVEAALR